MKVKKDNKREFKSMQREENNDDMWLEDEEDYFEEKPIEIKKPRVKYIQIKERTFDAEKNMQFSNWVVGKSFRVLDEDDATFTFGTDAKIKLGVVRKEDCIEV